MYSYISTLTISSYFGPILTRRIEHENALDADEKLLGNYCATTPFIYATSMRKHVYVVQNSWEENMTLLVKIRATHTCTVV